MSISINEKQHFVINPKWFQFSSLFAFPINGAVSAMKSSVICSFNFEEVEVAEILRAIRCLEKRHRMAAKTQAIPGPSAMVYRIASGSFVIDAVP